LIVEPVDQNVLIAGDRQVLAAVVSNLVQNTFKFTRPHTAVIVRVNAGAERVLIEVEDECGTMAGSMRGVPGRGCVSPSICLEWLPSRVSRRREPVAQSRSSQSRNR
jgi:hypothetical protein